MTTKKFDKMAQSQKVNNSEKSDENVNNSEQSQKVNNSEKSDENVNISEQSNEIISAPETVKDIIELLKNTEDREKQLELAKKLVGHKIKVVPFNTIEWSDGTIIGLYDDKRVKQPMLSIRLDVSKKKIVKAYNSKFVEISEEKAENVKIAKDKLTDEQVFDLLMTAKANIGLFAIVDKKELLIVGILHDKRNNTVMYTLKDAENKISHKVTTAVVLTDKKDEALFNKNAAEREILNNPAKKVEFLDLQIKKLESQLAEINERIAEKRKQLELTKEQIGSAEKQIEAAE